MFNLQQLAMPVIAAPMADGVSTPALAISVARAGGLGFLAAGYQSVEWLQAQVAETRAGTELFGVNLFVPGRSDFDARAIARYRELLQPLARVYDIVLPEPQAVDAGWARKLEALLDDPVPVVSFTFGCPGVDVVRRLRAAGSAVMVSVTSVADARESVAAGVDALVVQGPEAGGHRSTFRQDVRPPTELLDSLLAAVRAAVDVPLIAAGGIGTAKEAASALRHAQAVQVGTALLDADEAGTSAVYRQALHDPRFKSTTVTRAFSGRPARSLRNAFIDRFGGHTPAAFPAVHQLTAPIRRAAAAAGHADQLALWAGTSWRHAGTGPAAKLLETLLRPL